MSISSIAGTFATNAITHSPVGITTLALSSLALAVLSALPKAAAEVCPDAYTSCLADCRWLQIFGDLDKGYDSCIARCQAQFMNVFRYAA